MKNKLTAYLLAGGQSRRIGYDKLLTPILEMSLLEKTLGVCQQVCRPVKIAAKETEKFDAFKVDVIIDDPSANGPLAGIIASLEDCSDEYCFITAADFYDLDMKLIETLIENYNNEQCILFEINGRIQPLCSIYNKSALPVLKEAASEDNFRMINVLKKLQTRLIFITISPWRNINNPEEIKALRRENV